MLRRSAGALIVALALVAPVASAEEPKSEKARPQPTTERKTIRVLQDPKDISSFYRSGDSRTHPSGPYGLASHYRSSAERRTVGYMAWRTSAYEPCLYGGPDGPYRRR